MTKILFIVPPYVEYTIYTNPSFNEGSVTKSGRRLRNVVTDIPMGPLSLSAYLKKNASVKTCLLDFNRVLNDLPAFTYNSFEELFVDVISLAEYRDFNPDIVGISVLFTPAYHNMIDLARVARSVFPDSLILAGGGVPTNLAREIYEESRDFDGLCYGEGERALLDLILAEDRGTCLTAHPTWMTHDKIKAGVRFEYTHMDNLDEIPIGDFSLVDIDGYRANSILSTFPLASERNRSMPVITSRGCPHKCIFCASHTIQGRAMRYHSLERVREEFIFHRDTFGASAITFLDDHLMGDRRRFLNIVKILQELGLTAFFPASLALYALDREVLEALKSVGLTQLALSVESGSDRVLRHVMHKPLALKIVKRVIENCRDLGISPDVAVLIGLPGETKEDIEEGRRFLKTLDATWFRINIATPLVGSEMLDICLRRGYLTGSYIGCDFKNAIVETEDFSAEYIQDAAYSLNLELNFVCNSDMRAGRYDMALQGFENTLRVKEDHAFAHYYSALCNRHLGRVDRYQTHKVRYDKIVADSELWQRYVHRFELTALN